jgi:hypothetical protein
MKNMKQSSETILGEFSIAVVVIDFLFIYYWGLNSEPHSSTQSVFSYFPSTFVLILTLRYSLSNFSQGFLKHTILFG